MPFLSALDRPLHKILKITEKIFYAILFEDTVIRTARPHKHTHFNIDPECAEKKAYSAFLKCSMTIEASLALPLFVFAVCILVYPLKILDAQIRYQYELEELTRNLSVSCYLEKTAEGLIGENISDYTGMVSEVITAADVIGAADREILGIPVPTEIILPSDESDMIRVAVDTYVSFPFSEALSVSGIFAGFISERRAWVGRNGGAGSAYGKNDTLSGETDGEEEDITVWVALNASKSGRYHLSPECHYIANTVTAVPASSVASLRSADGGKYKPCSSCHPGNTGTVYIFRSGGSYHATAQCGAIRSYAEETTRSEAEERGLSPCSYCLAHYR